jgi:hypothetical protein
MSNYWWNRTDKDILEEIVSISWLYEKIFWKLLNKLVFIRSFENKKYILKKVFNFDDVEEIFEKQIERKEFNTLSKIIFRFANNENNEWKWFMNSKNNQN